MRFLIGFIVAVVAVFLAVIPTTSRVAAQGSVYDFEYNLVNLYTDYILAYVFTSLDATVEYEWTVRRLNPDGTIREIRFSQQRFGSTSAIVFFGIPTLTPWRSNEFGPFQVIDNFGRVLGTHFIAPEPSADWESASGNSPDLDKQTPGSALFNDNFGSGCASPIYSDINADGWHHQFTDCSVLFQVQSCGFFHYRQNFASLPTGDFYEFDKMPFAGGEFKIDADDLYLYQSTSGYLPRENVEAAQNFVQICSVTTGEFVFLNYERADAEFTTFDNPLRFGMTEGAYSCQKYTSALAWISDCESVAMIGSGGDEREFALIAQFSEMNVGGTQVVNRTAETLGIWQAYQGVWALFDDALGSPVNVDSTTYAFAIQRQTSYTVTPGVIGAYRVQWDMFPPSMDTNLMTITEAGIQVNDQYTLITGELFMDNVTVLMARAGLDSPMGNVIGFIAVISFGFLIGFMWKVASWFYTFAYLILGGMYVTTVPGVATITLVLYVMSGFVLLVWLFASDTLTNRGGGSDEFA